jgi:hypothetical protein
MSKYTLSASQLTAVQAMKEKGFTHGKIELEAQLNRCDSDGYEDCGDCDEGRVDCNYCNDSGVVEDTTVSANGRMLYITAVCDGCDGDGYNTCSTCDGDYESSGGAEWDEDRCNDFLHAHVSPEAVQALTYSEFYNDGSVDSEFTFTLKLDDLGYAVEYLDAFNALADAIGGGMDTDGAGMHLSVLTSGVYPSRDRLDADKLENFSREVTKLLPALYFVASPDHNSRSLQYRPCRIAPDKYAAISTHDGYSLEYRIFETCYQRPTALLEDFEVIANTLKYYSNRTVSLNEAVTVASSGYRGVARFYDNSRRLKALNDGLPFIKPKDKTVTKLKSERGFKINAKALALKDAIKRRVADRLYADYVANVESGNQERLEGARQRRIHTMSENYYEPYMSSYVSELISDLGATDEGLQDILTRYGYWETVWSIDDYMDNYAHVIEREMSRA